MRRLVVVFIILIIIIIVAGLGSTAVDPNHFTGQWYYSGDQSIYLFQEGLIFSSTNAELLSHVDSFKGAYTYCKDAVFLFVEDIDGLETEKLLYLLHSGDCSFLCENKDGSGVVYFIRYNK